MVAVFSLLLCFCVCFRICIFTFLLWRHGRADFRGILFLTRKFTLSLFSCVFHSPIAKSYLIICELSKFVIKVALHSHIR